ncbi:MAG: hypothetical protein QOF73_5548, partial [Thermomicrobiales bacterium]|nr:hypothetical protein [Thermomicrobiales bacterium]
MTRWSKITAQIWLCRAKKRGTATGIRTPVSAVRGRRPSPLDDSGAGVPDIADSVRRTWEHVFVHSPEIHAEVRRLAATGINDCEIARRLSVPRTTVRDIRKPRYRRKTVDVACPRCWLPAAPLRLNASEYAYLLGLYLGDGCIQRVGRTYSFRLSMDAKYPRILAEAREVMARCSPTGRVSQHLAGPAKTVAVLCVY